jgi:hypothetical protein
LGLSIGLAGSKVCPIGYMVEKNIYLEQEKIPESIILYNFQTIIYQGYASPDRPCSCSSSAFPYPNVRLEIPTTVETPLLMDTSSQLSYIFAFHEVILRKKR